MHLVELRFLRGPNLYADQPRLLALLDLAGFAAFRADDPPGFAERLTEGLALGPIDADALRAGLPMAETLELSMRALQALAGDPVEAGRIEPVAGQPARFRLIGGYRLESVGEAALATAMAAIAAVVRGEDFDWEGEIGRLRAEVARRALDGPTAARLEEARRRGVPVLELDDGGFQLGWGSRQRRLGVPADPAAPEPSGNGRIPAIAVTGTNGKTTTTLMIAHAVALAGRRVGVAATEGVFVAGRCIERGDCTGYWSARAVLESPEVDFAVLETARGGILKRGLGFDRCDVAVVLNLSEDHLGLEGVETLADLARVKAVVARAASRAAVLNAEDPLCVAIGAGLDRAVEIVYFSTDPDHPILRDHLARGGRAVHLLDGRLTLARGAASEPLLPAAAVPAALGGLARHNVANALAAAAALAACGFEPARIAEALGSFVSDARHNPLRLNLFNVRGATVIVDYAHNPAAYAAMAELARGLGPGRSIAVITSPGDRRDDDLRAIGETCARGFDELVAYENQSRGRPPGETVRRLLEGARRVDPTGRRLRGEPDIRRALRLGLERCRPGDVLVFACGTTLDELVETLRELDPESADRIAAEIA